MYQIANDCIKLSIYEQVEPQLVPNCLLQVLFIELHSIMAISPEDSVIKEAIDEDNNIIISDSTFCKILPSQLEEMTSRYKVIWGSEYCINAKSMIYYLLTWCYHRLKHIKDISRNAQNISSGEISSSTFETYNNAVWYQGCHIYNTIADILGGNVP